MLNTLNKRTRLSSTRPNRTQHDPEPSPSCTLACCLHVYDIVPSLTFRVHLLPAFWITFGTTNPHQILIAPTSQVLIARRYVSTASTVDDEPLNRLSKGKGMRVRPESTPTKTIGRCTLSAPISHARHHYEVRAPPPIQPSAWLLLTRILSMTT